MAHMMSSRCSTPVCTRTTGLTVTPRVTRTRLARAAVANDQPLGGKVGQDEPSKMWPPKPITEHGQPKPEDDPNPDADAGAGKAEKDVYVATPNPAVEKKMDFGSPTGGTQQGGGGEGSQS